MDGESIVIMSDVSALMASGHAVHLFCLNTRKHYVHTDLYSEMKGWSSFQSFKINPNGVFSSLLSILKLNSPYQLERFYNRNAQKIIDSIVVEKQIDTLICEGLALTLYTKSLKNQIGVIYRLHNIESDLWSNLGQKANFIMHLIYSLLARSIQKYERSLPKTFKLVTLSQLETRKLTERFDKVSSPIAISLEGKYDTTYNPEAKGILFVGSLDWIPNIEGLRWFMQRIYPYISHIPITIAGKGNIDRTLLNENVTVVENFPKLESLFSSHRLLIIPLLSGAGIRIKILEGIHYGIPILSTSRGAEGLFDDDEVILIEDDPKLFAEKLLQLYDLRSDLVEISKKEIKHYNANYNVETIRDSWFKVLM